MTLKIATLALLTGLITGCATPQVFHYSPSSTMTLEGQMSVGSFRYLPSEMDKSIKANQIQTPPPFEYLLENPVHGYFESALFNESRLVGINIKDSRNIVSGDIITFFRDVSFLDALYTLEVKYQVSNQDNIPCYTKVHKIEKHTEALNDQWNLIWNEVIKLNIEKLFQDPEFVACIRS